MKKRYNSRKQTIEELKEIREIETNCLDNAINKRFNLGVFVLGIVFGLISGVLGNYVYNIILINFKNYFYITLYILIILFIISISLLAYLLHKSHKEVKRLWKRYYDSEAEYQYGLCDEKEKHSKRN